jgi:hypothetical protein
MLKSARTRLGPGQLDQAVWLGRSKTFVCETARRNPVSLAFYVSKPV